MIAQAWQGILVLRFRGVIWDIDELSPEYTDEQIIDLLVISAKLVCGDLGLSSTYEINTQESTIRPDPLEAPEAEAFTNLILLRSQLMIATGEWRKSVKKSVEITFGRAHINTGTNASAYKDLVNELMRQYKDEINKYQLNNLGQVLAVMSGSPVGPDHDARGSSFPVRGELRY